MFDTNGNGCFDRWEVYLGDDPVPVRVSSVQDERARRVPFDENRLRRFYVEEALPKAMAGNAKLLDAMQNVWPFAMPEGLTKAMQTGSPGFRRYAQDVARELHYQDLRRQLMAEAHEVLRQAKLDDLRTLEPGELDRTPNSAWAWRLIRALERLDAAYGQGDFDAILSELGEVRAVRTSVK